MVSIAYKLIKNQKFQAKKSFIFYFRLIVIFFALLLILIKNIEFIQAYKNNINMLHVGEKISIPKLFIFFSQKGIKVGDSFIIHGFFPEFLEGFLAFKLLGTTIGSYLFFDTLLLILSSFIFKIILSLNINNNLIFLIATIFFLGTNINFRMVNNLITLLFLLLIYYVIKRSKITTQIYILLLLVIFINFFYSIEFAYYTLGSFIFFIIFSLPTFKINRLKYHFKKFATISVFFVLISSITLILNFIFWETLFVYVNRIITVIPILAYMIFKPKLPPIKLTYLYPYYIPFIIAFINFSILIFLNVMNKKDKFFLLFFFIFGLLNYYGIYIRANSEFIAYDKANISYFIWPQLVLSFILIDKLLIKKKIVSTSLIFILPLIIMIIPFWNKNCLFLYKKILNKDELISKIDFFIKLPRKNDYIWINNEQRKVIEFIKTHTNPNDFVFVFDNEVLYYYYIERRNPSIFYTAALAEKEIFQLNLINDLKQKKPKYIIYSSNYWSYKLNNISQSKRLNLVSKWLSNNYKKIIKIGNTNILFN